MVKECTNCPCYMPVCKLHGYFDEKGKPRVEKSFGCENDGCHECKKGV